MGSSELLANDSGDLVFLETTVAERTKSISNGTAPVSESVISFPSLTKARGLRVQKFHDHLHTPKFDKFFRPVSLSQVAVAMEFLDADYGRWDGDEDLAVWEYLLPALHKLFPEHRVYGFRAAFGPPQPASVKWSLPLWLTMSLVAALVSLGVLWCVLDR